MSAGRAWFAAEIGDPDATRTVVAIIALLVVMGVALVMVAFWLRRSTRPDPDFLAPLEVMGERSWRRGDPVWQRRRLDEVRPHEAEPLTKAAAPPHLDESFDAGPSGAGFDDLRNDDVQLGEEPPDTGRDWPPKPPAIVAPTAPAVPGDAAPDALDTTVAEPPTGVSEPGLAGHPGAPPDESRTPIASRRPLLDDLTDHEIDPEALRRAMEELDAELTHDPDDA